jgi:hypothetical protein
LLIIGGLPTSSDVILAQYAILVSSYAYIRSGDQDALFVPRYRCGNLISATKLEPHLDPARLFPGTGRSFPWKNINEIDGRSYRI